MKKKVIVSLGSNVNKKVNIQKARNMLTTLFDNDIRFTDELETKPIGIISGMFTNCLAFGYTDTEFTELEKKLKEIEHLCGDTAEKRSGNIVEMDIDILKYDNRIYHEHDWNRLYIKQLINK